MGDRTQLIPSRIIYSKICIPHIYNSLDGLEEIKYDR